MNHLARTILIAVCFTILVGSSSSQSFKSDNWFPVTVNGKAGYMDRAGKIVLDPKYDGVAYFSEGLARVSVGHDTIFTAGFSQGFIDEAGKVVITPQWDVASYFSEGLAAVGFDQTKQEFKIGNKTYYTSASHTWYRWGFINKKGEMVIQPKFSDISEFRDGVAVAEISIMSEWKQGYIDTNGEWVIPPKFDDANQFSSEGLARVFVNGKYGFIDATGTLAIPAKFSWARDFSEGLACVKIGGDVVKPTGMSSIRKRGRYAFIDKSGKEVIKLKNAECSSFVEGLARFEEYGVYGEGFIDRSGKIVIQPNGMGGQSDFSEGLKFVIRDEGKLGYIDRKGTVILDPPFGKMDDFYRGLASVCESYDAGAKCGYMDRTGKVIWQPTK